MNEALSLAQRLALVKFLTDTLAKVRKDDLIPQAAAEWPAGERRSVWFGGRQAGWASMPAASKTVTVKDEAALLAWAEANCPHHVESVDEAETSRALVAYLKEHAPEFLRTTRRVDPQFVTDLTGALKSQGYYVTQDGEKVTEVPGVAVGETEPAPRVNLTEGVARIIADAWRAGDIPVADLLALPAAGNGATP